MIDESGDIGQGYEVGLSVVGGVVEVEDPGLGPANTAVVSPVLDGDAPDEHAVDGTVAGDEVRTFGSGEFVERVVEG